MIAVRLLVDGTVVREAVFRGAPLVIGRGPESDFALVEASVSREHARVVCDETGALFVEDAGSRNGLRVGNERVQRSALSAGAPVRCQLGAVDLELALSSPGDTQEIALPTPFARGPLPVLKAIGLWAAAVAAVACNTMTNPAFWSPWDQSRLSTLAQATVGVAIALPLTAFVLVGLLRIVRRRARVGEALRSLAVVCWTWLAVSVLLRATVYLLPVSVHGVFGALLASATSALTIAYVATTARKGPNRRFFLVWVGVMALVIAAFASVARLAVRQAGTPQVDHDVPMPIAGFSGPATSLDGYLGGVRSDYAAADRAAAEERKYSAARQ